MDRFILRYTGKGATPPTDLDAIRGRSGVTVLDTSGRMVLVRAAEPVARELAGGLAGWTVAPETTVPVPDPRPKPRKADGE